MTYFPTLYKKTSTGKVEQWRVWTEHDTVVVEHGQVGGKLQQSSQICQPKNVGRANETTAAQQAELEAQAKWTKQVQRKGYVENLARAEQGESDQDGGIVCMLAHRYDKYPHKMPWPAYASPKLDGIRCIAVKDESGVTLWSRQREQIHSMPHIVAAIERLALPDDAVLDGELFVADRKFEDITSFVRSREPKNGHEAIEYHVFDIPSLLEPFKERYAVMTELLWEANGPVKLVKNVLVADEKDMMSEFHGHLAAGYEGLMLRDPDSPYEHKRSYGLLKVKLMADDEWPIVSVKEGRGKMAGLAIFTCQVSSGETFDVKMKGELSELAKYLLDESLWRGKKLTVQYQNLTATGLPRFPVGLRIREE